MQTPSSSPARPLVVAAAFLLLLLAAWWSFSTGLGGKMIFDDEPNLIPWASIGDIRSLHDLLALSFSSQFAPGRPIALASFVIDDQSWPPDIATLKRTNLAVHLINACLVFWLGLQLLARLLPRHPERTRAWLALFAAAVWTLHPVQVSNVSYVIQRMNLLSTTLQLIGLLLYLHGRARLETHPRQALLYCSLGIGAFMPLAILAKENGLLLCAFALLAEAYCFPRAPWRWWKAWKLLMLWGPLLAFVAYCLVKYRGFTVPYITRDFNAWERLLTQGPVLLDYLDKLLLPRLHGTGLYFDNFPVSRSLFSPPGTALAWLLVIGLLAVAWYLRRRQPLVSFGIFFYFCGHLMESTLLPLELYFEHRNYLPQFGLWLALAGLLALAHTARLQRLLVMASVASILMLGWMARQNAALWAHTDLQAAVWYRDNPGSLRTTMSYANSLVVQRRLEEAATVLDRGRQELPDALIVALSQRYVRCYLMGQPVDFDDLPALARHARHETASLEMLAQMWGVAKEQQGKAIPDGACRPASFAQLAAVYRALLANPRFAPGREQAKLYSNLAAYAHQQGDLDQVITLLDKAYAAEPNPLYPFEQAATLMSAGLPEAAGQYIQRARATLSPQMRLQYPAMETNLDRLEQARQQQMRALAPRGSRP